MIDSMSVWFNENVQIILTTLGFTGAGTGALTGVWLFVKGLKDTLVDKFDNSDKLLQKQVDELKEQNKVLMDYVQTSARAKAESNVLSDEVKSQFASISNEANSFTSKFKEIVESVKDKVNF